MLTLELDLLGAMDMAELKREKNREIPSFLSTNVLTHTESSIYSDNTATITIAVSERRERDSRERDLCLIFWRERERETPTLSLQIEWDLRSGAHRRRVAEGRPSCLVN